MQGLIEEGREHVEADGDEDVIDAALIAAAQKVEHYEISAYGTAREHATCTGHTEIADLLQQTLDEEKDADRKLSALAEDLINRQAVGSSMEDDSGLDELRRRGIRRRAGEAHSAGGDGETARAVHVPKKEDDHG